MILCAALRSAVVALTNRSAGGMPQYIANLLRFAAAATINSAEATKTHTHTHSKSSSYLSAKNVAYFFAAHAQQSRHVIDVTLAAATAAERERERESLPTWQPKIRKKNKDGVVHCTAYTLFTFPLDISCEISREITQSSR